MGNFSCVFMNQNQERGMLAITDRSIIFEFFPKTNTPEDKKKAADIRDRFNLLISLYLSPTIKDLLFYDEIVEEDHPYTSSEDPKTFKILLKFRDKIDLKLVDNLFGYHSPIAFCDMQKFFTESSYKNMIDEYQKYFLFSYTPRHPMPADDKPTLGIYSVLNRVYQHAALLHEISKELLLLNIWKKQETLIYSSLSNQKFVIDHMKEAENKDQHLYDDIYLINDGIKETEEGLNYSSLYLSEPSISLNRDSFFSPSKESDENDQKESLMTTIAKKWSQMMK